jgi:hypothetical protein
MPATREDASAKRARIALELADLEREESDQGQSALALVSEAPAATATTERRSVHALASVYPRGWQHALQPRKA